MIKKIMIKNLNKLEIAEYIALAGAVAGTILGTVFGQFYYAAWPLCLALCLNVVNRRYGVNQGGYSRSPIDISRGLVSKPPNLSPIDQLEQKFEQKIATLESTIIQSQEQLNQELNRCVGILNSQTQSVAGNVDSMKALDSLVGAVQQLRSQQQQLHKSIKLIKDQLNQLTEQFKQRPELEQIESLSTVIVALKQAIDDLDRS
jgi:uncharacterized coiled-coil protein SlyX